MRIYLALLLLIGLGLWHGSRPEEVISDEPIEVRISKKAFAESNPAEKPDNEKIVEKEVTWQDNPNNCKPDRIRADNLECLPDVEPVGQPQGVAVSTADGMCERYRSEIAKYDWPVETALAICACESGGNHNALNSTPPDYSVGLFQINLYGALAVSRPSESWLRNPSNNISYAYGMYQSSGFTPWTCFYKI